MSCLYAVNVTVFQRSFVIVANLPISIPHTSDPNRKKLDWPLRFLCGRGREIRI